MSEFLIPKGHTYSTEDVSKRDRIEYWNDMVCAEFVQLDCTCNKAYGFEGKIRSCKIEDVQFSEVKADPQNVFRSKRQIAKCGEREFLLSLQLEEAGIVSQEGRIAELHPGDFVLYDSTRPYQLRFFKPFRQIVLQIPYESLAKRFLKHEGITARRISTQTGIGGLTSLFIQSVASRSDMLPQQDRKTVTEHIIDLVALSIGSASSLKTLDRQSIARTTRFERIRRYIEVNIRKPQLSAPLIAAHHGISERYLRMLFASNSTTVSRYILEKRLELCREALKNDSMSHHNLAQLAFDCGFNDAAHFSRRFKERYGVAPREYRAENRSAAYPTK